MRRIGAEGSEIGDGPAGVRRAVRTAAVAAVATAALGAALAAAGCEGTPSDPGSLRFGQTGEVRVRVVSPRPPEGEVQQVLAWDFRGSARLLEAIEYRGLLGDDQIRESGADQGAYASLIAQLNENPDLDLFAEELDPGLDPTCGPTRSRVTVTVRDHAREEEVSWTRCASGELMSLDPESAAPDPLASRVVRAALLVRDYVLPPDFRSAYDASLPFGTLDRGEDSGAALQGPLVFVGEGGAAPSGWSAFWSDHAGAGSSPPAVDWSSEMVLVAAVGVRHEAGDSVEVRRVVPADGGTVAEAFERVPGNFCSPAERTHVPFHVVVAPLAPLPVTFPEIVVERVPCGI